MGFQERYEESYIMSVEKPLLLIRDSSDETYEGQTGGVCCLHPEATGFLFNLHRAGKLGRRLDGEHHRKWCGFIDGEGLAEIDRHFAELAVPLMTTGGWSHEGWVSVEVVESSDDEWGYLQPYVGRSGILIWNNCD